MYSAQMRQELRSTDVMSGFTTRKDHAGKTATTTHNEGDEEDIDIDLNLVSNFLESFSAQQVRRLFHH